MKRSTDRILTTHVGSLARPDDLVAVLRSKDRGHSYDRETYARLVREAVADVVRRQTETGVDIVTDGEQGKASFFGYIVERFNGFARKPAPAGQEGNPRGTSSSRSTPARTPSRRPIRGTSTRTTSSSRSARPPARSSFPESSATPRIWWSTRN
jgi:methionine synthase II (cobalamin-independent)